MNYFFFFFDEMKLQLHEPCLQNNATGSTEIRLKHLLNERTLNVYILEFLI